ncbi:MAG: heme lyase CcmF/NrfE family subunit [Myxococcota bacterium]|nr:heme lyase CcmF/NrfE family subunit [Myxococcota bacterium]
MNAALGHSLVLLSLVMASAGSILGLWAGYRQSARAMAWTRVCVYGFAATMVLANAVMVYALLVHDFSVSYVAQVGSLKMPTWVTVVSLWSSLEGSILFWGAILGGYVGVFTYQMTDRYREYVPYATGVLLGIAAFFAFLIAGPSNPFIPMDPVPTDGPGPNPLLQNHILMVVHPPLLYLGYVGMSVPFAIAVAALLRGELSAGWLKPLRRWTMFPWTFLTLGIIVGGWWAYEVLGWGGYWAWDPVENASFLPWLAATGYLHSTVVQERKKMLKVWTLSLVLAAFLLTILGTFMTRSGVFNSVHSFTQSPIGPVFLGFLAVMTAISILLLAFRAHLLEDEGRIEAVASRETAFLLNNLIFVIFTFTVLLGTVFPLITEAVRDVKVSVGEPYFNQMAVPIGLLMVFMMGVGPVLPWGRPNMAVVVRSFITPLISGITTTLACWAAGLTGAMTLATFGVCGFAATVTLREMFAPVWIRMNSRGEAPLDALRKTLSGNRRKMGGYVVHMAVIIIVVAIAGSQSYKQSVEVSLTPGQSFELGPYAFVFHKTEANKGGGKFTVSARVEAFQEGESVGMFAPALNYYPSQREPIGSPDVQAVGSTDLYLSLLSFEKDGSRVGIKAYLMPMVPWIWWSLPIIMLGSMTSLWPRRRRKTVVTSSAEVATS